MEKTKDPVYPAFQKRGDPSYLDGFVEALQTDAFRRRDAELERQRRENSK